MAIYVKDEAVNAAAALADLLYELAAQMPEVGPQLRQGARITFDLHEAAFIVGSRNPDGTSTPILAITADPSEPMDFGRVGVPSAHPTTQTAPRTWH
jgi:hypothetical protein